MHTKRYPRNKNVILTQSICSQTPMVNLQPGTYKTPKLTIHQGIRCECLPINLTNNSLSPSQPSHHPSTRPAFLLLVPSPQSPSPHPHSNVTLHTTLLSSSRTSCPLKLPPCAIRAICTACAYGISPLRSSGIPTRMGIVVLGEFEADRV